MPGMGIGYLLGIVLTWTSAAAQPPAQMEAMRREAEAIWRPHGVTLALLTPAQAGAPAAADGRLVVTLADAPRRHLPGRPTALGGILFDHDNVPATTVTIDVGAVSATVAAVRWGGRTLDHWPAGLRDAVLGRALGRVLAHEVGHYLLASRAHGDEGLMRARFDGDELARPGRRAFTIAARDLPRLRARLAGLDRTSTLAEREP
jgi:hypothetical protein